VAITTGMPRFRPALGTTGGKSRLDRPPPLKRLVAICAVAVLLSAACDRRDGATPQSRTDDVIRIALVGETKNDPAWPVLQDAAKRFSSRTIRADVEPMAPDTSSPEEQARLLLHLVNEPFQAVCIVPADPAGIRTAIRDLVQHGKRVVTIGRDVPLSDRQTYCGPSQLQIGAAAVRACRSALMGRAKSIILLHAGSEESVYADRYIGFSSHLPTLQDVQLLRELNCGGNSLEAQRLVRVESHRYPRVGCWVMLDDWPLRGISASERLLPLGCGIVLCKGSPAYFPRLRDGQILALVTYDFRRAVDEALFAALRIGDMLGHPEDGSFDSPVEIITIRELPEYEERWKDWQGQFASATPAASSRPQKERAERP